MTWRITFLLLRFNLMKNRQRGVNWQTNTTIRRNVWISGWIWCRKRSHWRRATKRGLPLERWRPKTLEERNFNPSYGSTVSFSRLFCRCMQSLEHCWLRHIITHHNWLQLKTTYYSWKILMITQQTCSKLIVAISRLNGHYARKSTMSALRPNIRPRYIWELSLTTHTGVIPVFIES